MTRRLLTADVGNAIGAGTDVAVEAGDVVLVRSDPNGAAARALTSQRVRGLRGGAAPTVRGRSDAR